MNTQHGLGAIVSPASVANLQEKLFNDFTAIDRDVSACTAFTAAQQANWNGFRKTFETWYNIEPYSWNGYWTAGDLYDQGLQIQTQLIAWQQMVTAAGCTTTEPAIQPPAAGIDWASAKVIALSMAAIGGVFLLYPIVKEATAWSREERESGSPPQGGLVHRGAKKLASYTAPAEENPIDDDPIDEHDEAFSEFEMEEGYTIQDGRSGGYDVYHNHKSIGHFSSVKTALKAIKVKMTAENFTPNIYYVNDHGNVDLLSHTGRIIASRV